MTDIYKETKVFEYPNMKAKVHIPDITPEERRQRMKNIKAAAGELLKERKRNEAYTLLG